LKKERRGWFIHFFIRFFYPGADDKSRPGSIKGVLAGICQAFIAFFFIFLPRRGEQFSARTQLRGTGGDLSSLYRVFFHFLPRRGEQFSARTQLRGDWRGFVKLLSLKTAVERGWLVKPPRRDILWSTHPGGG
jgi:hypothetical protein